MCTAPPIARERLIGLAGASKTLVKTLEKSGHLPPRMSQAVIDQNLERIADMISRLIDEDIFPWRNENREPNDQEIHRAATIVADRPCGANADPIVRNAQEARQLIKIKNWLEVRGYRDVSKGTPVSEMKAGDFAFRCNLKGLKDDNGPVNIPVDVAVKSLGSAHNDLPLMIEAKSAGDFTTITPPQDENNKFNLIICNPPYVRHHHISPAQKRKMQVSLARNINFELNGLSGLYTYFMLLSQAWMVSNGIGAWLVPSEFMDVNYGSKVKEFLLSRVSLLRIHRFDPNDVQFTDALVSSAIVVYKNCLPDNNHTVQLSSGNTLLKPNKVALFDTETLYRSNKWSSLITRTSGPVATSQTKKSDIQTLGELFTIKRGIATGCNSFFIVTKQRAVEMKLPKKFLIPILPGPRELEVDFIEASQNGDPKISNPHYLISCNLPEAILKEEYPDLWKYFQIGVEQRINERYLSRHRTPWYSQEIRPPAPFLCTYMGRSGQNNASPFRFITNRSRATAPNVYLMLYPKNKLEFLLGNDSRLYASIGKALGSIAPDMLTGKGRVYGGGLYKLEPKELANVPANIVLDVIKVDKDISLPIQLKMF